MEALGAAGVCIGDWVEQHRRVLGTRRVVGPGLVLQAATVRASDEQLTFDATTTFAHIRVSRQVFGEVTGSCLSDVIYPIMDANPNLLGCTLDLVNADTDALVSVVRSKASAKVGTRVTNFITPLFQDLDEGGKRKAGCQFSAQRAKKEEVPVIHHERFFEVKDCASVLPVFLFLQMGPRPGPTHTMVSPPRFFILPPLLLHGHCIVQIHSLVLVTNQLSPLSGWDSMNHSQTLFAWSTVFCVQL